MIDLPNKIGIEITEDTIWVGQLRRSGEKMNEVFFSMDYDPEIKDEYNERALAIAHRIVESWNMFSVEFPSSEQAKEELQGIDAENSKKELLEKVNNIRAKIASSEREKKLEEELLRARIAVKRFLVGRRLEGDWYEWLTVETGLELDDIGFIKEPLEIKE